MESASTPADASGKEPVEYYYRLSVIAHATALPAIALQGRYLYTVAVANALPCLYRGVYPRISRGYPQYIQSLPLSASPQKNFKISVDFPPPICYTMGRNEIKGDPKKNPQKFRVGECG